MARIRSVHPGLFTDEKFMALTVAEPLACVLLLGVWCEADDQGVFEWKPLVLKARILPAASADIESLLRRLARQGFIAAFVSGGKPYAAIRNFQKFQRPKKPNAIHPLPDEFRTFVVSGVASSEPDEVERPSLFGGEIDPPENLVSSPPPPVEAPPIPQKGENLAQMEDGGDKGRKNSQAGFLSRDAAHARETGDANGHAHPPPDDPLGVGVIPGAKIDPESGRLAVRGIYVDVTVRNCQQAAGMDVSASLPDSKVVGAWLNDGYDHDAIVAAIRRRAGRRGYSPAFRLAFFDAIVRQDCTPTPPPGDPR